MLRGLKLALGIAATCIGTLAWAQPHRGGSNFLWYAAPNCNQNNWYAIANYDVDKATIDAVLQQMYANGQRSLRVPILHMTSSAESCSGSLGTRGSILLSAGGHLTNQCQANLAALLTTMVQIGFSDFEFSFHPQWTNSPSGWPANWQSMPTYQALYQENKQLIFSLKPLTSVRL